MKGATSRARRIKERRMKRIVLLALLVLTLVSIHLATPAASASAGLSVGDATTYSCPWYSRYCSTNAQCRGYCGPGVPPEWEICWQGCCACLG
jgi:hypothetical protein